MILNIKKINDKQFEVNFSDQKLEIDEKSPNWNIEGINKFLINLASKTPDDEKIELRFDDKEEDKIYKHICFLFKNFCDEYNRKIESK